MRLLCIIENIVHFRQSCTISESLVELLALIWVQKTNFRRIGKYWCSDSEWLRKQRALSSIPTYQNSEVIGMNDHLLSLYKFCFWLAFHGSLQSGKWTYEPTHSWLFFVAWDILIVIQLPRPWPIVSSTGFGNDFPFLTHNGGPPDPCVFSVTP